MASSVSECGVGVLFNPALADFIADHAQHLDYVAVIPDRFWIDRGLGTDPRFEDTSAGEALLAQAAPRLPIVMHGIGLSICSADVFDREYLIQLERWRARYDCQWVSEHLSFSRIGAGHETNAGIALPVPFDRSIIDMLSEPVPNAAWKHPVRSRSQRFTWCSWCRRSNHLLRTTPGTGLSANHCAHSMW